MLTRLKLMPPSGKPVCRRCSGTLYTFICLAGSHVFAAQPFKRLISISACVEQIKSKTEKKKDKLFTMDPQQISFDMVRQKLKELVMTRGKRGVDRNEQVEMLTYLGTVSKGPVQKIEVLIQVVSALFDINPSMSTHMAIPLWKRCAGTLLEVLQTLADNQYIEVDEAYDNPEERTEEPPAGQPVKVGLCTVHTDTNA